MSRVLPILFIGDMVRAILDGRKTVTRRVVKQATWEDFVCEGGMVCGYFDKRKEDLVNPINKAPYQPGDILYVRETWAFIPCVDCNMGYSYPVECQEEPVTYEDRHGISEGCFIYREDFTKQDRKRICFNPSIHMPKQAARIWLKVTNVKVERLQDMKPEDLRKEIGKPYLLPEECKSQFDKFGAIYYYQEARTEFSKLWDTVIKKQDIAKYGWMANPWVWVIEFERCGKPEEET